MTTTSIGATAAEIDGPYPLPPAPLSKVPNLADEDEEDKPSLHWTERFARIPAEVLREDNHVIATLAVLYGLANNTLTRVFVDPAELCRALGITEEYATGDLSKTLAQTVWVTDWSVEYHADKEDYWWAIQLAPVPKNDFLKVMWWWLFEDPADHDGDRWVRTASDDGKPWSNRSPALASALAVQRYGKADKGVRHSVTDTYGTTGLAKAVRFTERTLQKGLVEASERGWIGVSNRLGGKAKHAKRWVRWRPDYAGTQEPGHHGSPDHPNRAVAAENRRKQRVEATGVAHGLPLGWLDAEEPPF